MNTQEKVRIVEDGIRKYAPVVAEYLDCDTSVLDYSRNLYSLSSHAEHLTRQQLVCERIGGYIEKIFNYRYSPTPPLIINIVDHQAILNHPILVGTNIIANAFRLLGDGQPTPRPPIIALTSSIVPLNNFFSRKGFQYHGRTVLLTSNTYIRQATCFMDKQSLRFAERMQAAGVWQRFPAADQVFLEEMQREISAMPIAAAEDFNDQISIINRHLWKRLFHPAIRDQVPELFYIPAEKIFRNLVSAALADPRSIIHRSLFNPAFREHVLREFDGLTGCWDERHRKGTHFFWYRNSKNEAERMYLTEDHLVAEKSKISLPLRLDDLTMQLRRNSITPNLFLIYGYLCFWCGLKPLSGYGSSKYLTDMKGAWQRVLRAVDAPELRLVGSIDTKALIGGPIVTFQPHRADVLIPQYAFDIIGEGGLTRQYLEHVLAMRFKDILRPALPEVYKSYVPLSERADIVFQPGELNVSAWRWLWAQ